MKVGPYTNYYYINILLLLLLLLLSLIIIILGKFEEINAKKRDEDDRAGGLFGISEEELDAMKPNSKRNGWLKLQRAIQFNDQHDRNKNRSSNFIIPR